jgi:V/A-type H+-transporting ATPase subunit A
MPAEDGYPAYLATRLAGFYERAGAAVCLGRDQRRGSVTIVGAVSPAGGDFSEPITQHTLRMAGTFWALDRDLARARHFPAVDWRRSYTLYRLDGWFTSKVAPGWRRQREWALDLLQRETSLLEIVQLLGADTLPPQQQVVLRTGRLLREDFLQQSSFDETDAYCPLDKQHAMLGVIRAAHEAMSAAVSGGVPAADVTGARILGEIARMRGWPPAEAGAHADDLTRRIQAALALEAAPQPDAAPHPEAGPEPEASAEPEAGAGQGGDAR